MKNNALSIAPNKIIAKKNLIVHNLLNQQKAPELSTNKLQLQKHENQQISPG